RDFITRALVMAGYGVAAAGCGTEGLGLALAGGDHLGILDPIMPDIGGRPGLAQGRRGGRGEAGPGGARLARGCPQASVPGTGGNWAPRTTSPSPSHWPNCWPGSGYGYAARCTPGARSSGPVT